MIFVGKLVVRVCALVNSMWINWNDNCEAKSEAKSPRPLRGWKVDFSLTRNVSYTVRFGQIII